MYANGLIKAICVVLLVVATDVLSSVRRTVFVEPGVKPPEPTIIRISPAP